MGAIESNNAIYLTIADGKISRKVMQPTDKSVQRTNKNNKVVNEEFYKGWKGLITDIQVRDTKDFGKFWNITLSDSEGDAILQMNYSSGYAQAFLKKLPNVDLASPVDIIPSLKMEGEKKKTSLFVNQHGASLPQFYTREKPNGCPELKQIKIKGKLTYDDSDIMEFLEAMVNNDIRPKLPKVGKPAAVPVAAGIQEEDDVAAPF